MAVWHGRVEVVGEGRRIELAGPEELIAHDRRLEDHRILRDPVEGEFERFAFERDRELDRAAALRYVPDDLIGYRELDRYGRWEVVRDYGPVWFPSRVSLGWTPYRYGHWVWLPVYGWTWIDEAPWGFAVSHYGRWIWWGGRWGWVPCPRRYRAYWAPALVVFYGGRHWSVGYASAPVGWFPLGPGDIWLPWYSASWDYFHRVNVWNTWIGHGTIVNVYQNIYLRGDLIVNLEYRFRDRDFAWTFVPEDNFRRGRPVHRHLLPVGREDVARAELRRVLGVVPTTASLKGDAPAARGLPDEGVFGREAVVSRAPAARPALLPFAEGEASPAVGARERGLRVVGAPIASEGLGGGGRSRRARRPRSGPGPRLGIRHGRERRPAPGRRRASRSHPALRDQRAPRAARRRRRAGGAPLAGCWRSARRRTRSAGGCRWRTRDPRPGDASARTSASRSGRRAAA
ncbi:MAG: hypothetical protein RML12_09920 [Xanthomonadales bacterium]|nr:hypothetical protein [Xanthomonadales bacterium]